MAGFTPIMASDPEELERLRMPHLVPYLRAIQDRCGLGDIKFSIETAPQKWMVDQNGIVLRFSSADAAARLRQAIEGDMRFAKKFDEDISCFGKEYELVMKSTFDGFEVEEWDKNPEQLLLRMIDLEKIAESVRVLNPLVQAFGEAALEGLQIIRLEGIPDSKPIYHNRVSLKASENTRGARVIAQLSALPVIDSANGEQNSGVNSNFPPDYPMLWAPIDFLERVLGTLPSVSAAESRPGWRERSSRGRGGDGEQSGPGDGRTSP